MKEGCQGRKGVKEGCQGGKEEGISSSRQR
jgi:hypothetical protein